MPLSSADNQQKDYQNQKPMATHKLDNGDGTRKANFTLCTYNIGYKITLEIKIHKFSTFNYIKIYIFFQHTCEKTFHTIYTEDYSQSMQTYILHACIEKTLYKNII